MRRIAYIFIVLIVISHFVAIRPASALGFLIYNETRTIQEEAFIEWVILTEEIPVTTSEVNITTELTILSGGAVDLILFTETGYTEFILAMNNPANPFTVIDAGSALDVAESVTTSTLQEQGIYYVVVENSRAIEGAVPIGPVTIYLAVTVYDKSTKGSPVLDILTGDIGVFVIIVIVVTSAIMISYYLVKNRKRKRKWVRKMPGEERKATRIK